MLFLETWMELEIIILNEVNQIEKKYFLCVASKKMTEMNIYTQKKRSTDIEINLWLPKKKKVGEVQLWSLVLTYKHCYI